VASEAGALVTAMDGSAEYLTPPCSLLAAPPAIYSLMLKLLQEENTP
jgi:hypothetical protein